jgi:hypothetical protein
MFAGCAGFNTLNRFGNASKLALLSPQSRVGGQVLASEG